MLRDANQSETHASAQSQKNMKWRNLKQENESDSSLEFFPGNILWHLFSAPLSKCFSVSPGRACGRGLPLLVTWVELFEDSNSNWISSQQLQVSTSLKGCVTMIIFDHLIMIVAQQLDEMPWNTCGKSFENWRFLIWATCQMHNSQHRMHLWLNIVAGQELLPLRHANITSTPQRRPQCLCLLLLLLKRNLQYIEMRPLRLQNCQISWCYVCVCHRVIVAEYGQSAFEAIWDCLTQLEDGTRPCCGPVVFLCFFSFTMCQIWPNRLWMGEKTHLL